MEALRRGWDSLLSTPEVRKEEDAVNLALALSLSEEEQRLQEEQDHYHTVFYEAPLLDANLAGPQRPRSCRADPREAAVAELPRKLRASLERALAEEEQKADDNNSPTTTTTTATTTLPELDPQDAERLSSPRLLSLGADFDEKMQRIASAFDLSSLRSAFSPRVNPDEDEPNEDALSHSLRRLQRRLNKFTLVEYTISGDGNCQFASLSDQLYRTPKMQSVVRRLVVQQLTDFPEHYSRFVPGDYKFYCWKMSQNHVWGDHLTLQAAADRYGIQISLITSYKDAPYMHIMPREIKSCRILRLSFFGELHYNSLYTEEDIALRRRMDENNAGCTLF